MTKSHRWSRNVITILIGSVLTGCLARRPEQFAISFLPAPLPAAVQTQASSTPPLSYIHSTPNLVQKTLPHIDWPTEIDSRILRADQRFDTAKKLYQRGDMEGARREFNRAIDFLITLPEDVPSSPRLERKLEELVNTIHRYDLEGLGSGESQDQDKVVFDKSPIDGILEMTFPVDPNLTPKVREEIQATVSQLPLEVNDLVLGYIHYFSTDRGRRTIAAGLRRSGRYQPLIRKVLDEEGVPQELIYLAQAESGFMPRAVSNRKAEGMWQFVQDRGRQYGLMQTPANDDRLDPEKATRAAARHLRDLYTHFGDWYLAIAAYNCGPGRVDNAVMRTGYADYWEIRNRHALPKETENYVPLIVAITIMAKNPKDYGLDGIELDQPVEYDTLDLKAATNVGLIADAVDRPVSEIRDLNPGLLKAVAPAGYQLRIPKGTSNTVLAALANVPSDRRMTWRMHRVERGETLAQIAKEFSTPATSIAQANNRLQEAPEAGDLLIIPASFNPDLAVTKRAKNTVPVASRRGKASKTYKTSKTSRKPVTARAVPERILNHRASQRAYKTATLRVSRDSE